MTQNLSDLGSISYCSHPVILLRENFFDLPNHILVCKAGVEHKVLAERSTLLQVDPLTKHQQSGCFVEQRTTWKHSAVRTPLHQGYPIQGEAVKLDEGSAARSDRLKWFRSTLREWAFTMLACTRGLVVGVHLKVASVILYDLTQKCNMP